MSGDENRGGGGRLRDDEAVFATLYPNLRRFAAVVGAYHDDPDDLVQEALARVLAAGGLAVARDPGAYLRTAIVRIASNDRRRTARGTRIRRASPRFPSSLWWAADDERVYVAPMSTDEVIAELSCVRVIHRYATAVDAIDIERLRTCFFDDVESSYVGQPFTQGITPIVEMISRLERLKGTIHNLGPVSAIVDGASAHATAGCLVLAVSNDATPHGVIRGVKYTFELAHRDGEWRIIRLEHRVLWATAAPQSGLMGEAITTPTT